MNARYANPDGTDVALLVGDVTHAVKPGDPRLAGVTIEPYSREPRAAVHAAFAARLSDGYPVSGQVGAVQMDDASRNTLDAAAAMAGRGIWPAKGFWRLSDNTNLPLDGAALSRLADAVALYYLDLFGTRSALLDAVAAGETVNPAKGWPKPAAFDPAG